MVELADAQDLGSCAARRVGSTPTTRIQRKARWFVQNQRVFSYRGNTFGNTIKFSGCSHQRIIQHFNELHRAGRTGQRIACQLLHILRVCEPCTFSCPADSALKNQNAAPTTPPCFSRRLRSSLLHWADCLRRYAPPPCSSPFHRANKKEKPAHNVYWFFLVRPGGFEPLAFRVGAERSIQLSYDRTYLFHRCKVV